MAATWISLDVRAVKSVQATTEAAPTISTEGLNLLSIEAFAVTVECDSGQTFASSAGKFDIYMWDDNVGAWSLLPDREQPIPADAVGKRRYTMLFTVVNPRGRVALIANGLGLTGGGVTLYFSPSGSWDSRRPL